MSYVQSLPVSSSAESATLGLIALALRVPAVFNFDSVLKLENVQAQKAHPLFGLLQIVNEKGLEELRTWIGQNGTLLESYRVYPSFLRSFGF